MKDSHQSDELGVLLAAICDETITTAQCQRLNQMLFEDAAARTFYLDYLALHGILAWDLASTSHEDELPELPEGKVAGGGNSNVSVGSTEVVSRLTNTSDASGVGSPALRFLKASLQQGASFAVQSRYSLALLMGVATACVLGTLLVSGHWTKRSEVVADNRAPYGEYVATLVGSTAGGVNSVVGASRDGSRLPAGDVRLNSGVAEIMFDSGAKVVLQGPARFTPQSSRGGLLHYGRLVASIPPQANPFTVQTRLAVVSGQQNEMAVRADDQGFSEVHVFQGSAEVATRRPGSSEMDRSLLNAGDALRVEPDKSKSDRALQTLTADPGGFVRSLPTRQLRFPASLVAYWNFDEDGGPVFDQRGNNHGLVQGVRRAEGLIGRGALEFANETGQLVNIGSDKGTFQFGDGITLEAIVVPRWNGAYGSYREILRKDDGNHRLLLSFQHDSYFEYSDPHVPQGPVLSFGANLGGKYQELDMPLDGQQGRPKLADLTDGQPHHIVATYQPRTGEKSIFVDGKFCFGTRVEPGTRLLAGGKEPAFIGSWSGWETFDGLIDELAIYNAALSPQEISQHWKNVQQRHSYFEVDGPNDVNDST